ncbi:MAG: A/G-specific adenine glycosylase [Halobacteriaceae archaeon]
MTGAADADTGGSEEPGSRDTGTGDTEDVVGDAAGESLPGTLDGVDLPAARSALVSWYEDDHRAFPWRETTDPYAILVCEVMSQQTQLGRVVEAWEAFLDRWPTVGDLAAADRADVVAFWSDQSLGYNNRARYLHEAATQVLEEFDGAFPRDPEGLQALMGVGPYTANAVASFAFDAGDAVVDTNVKRVLHRAFDVPDDDAAFERAASALMPAGESRVWNNAVMELGGVACGQTPACDEADCPWRDRCVAYRTGDFTAPDVPTQPSFEGSRRQMRGRVVRALGEHGELALADLGPRVAVDFGPEGEHDRAWLRDLLADLADDGLVEVDGRGSGSVVRLSR